MFPRKYTNGRYVPSDVLTYKKSLDINLSGSSYIESVALLTKVDK